MELGIGYATVWRNLRTQAPRKMEDMEPYKFPLPPTDQDFEALVERLSRDRHPDATVQRFGRNGQAQHGVDVLITRADGTSDGYQCKHVKSLGENEVSSESLKATAFPGGISRFIIYTTAPRDTSDQLAARKATKTHPFLVIVSSWDDIAVDLMNNLGASQRYMAELPLHDITAVYVRQLSIVFDRPAFTHPAGAEWSHQMQLDAIRDVEEFLATGQLNTRDARFVLRSLPASSVPGTRSHIAPIRKCVRDLRHAVTPAARAEKVGDYVAIPHLRAAIEVARIALMRAVTSALIAHQIDVIDFDGSSATTGPVQ
ncbi:hypothetical protein [uncultured Microbacterium sp.]|uniref:hypothetical protein n=1 Tax=uncultured Microbacterium sp. TaxID=191216 RepID=UPI0025E58081|nr:hypothetical protein [uncultured Microbacterium sp.]